MQGDRDARRASSGAAPAHGHGSTSWQTTRIDALLAWARSSSMAPYGFVSGCCGAEISAAFGARFDLERFGVALPRHAPEHADLLIVAGSITRALAPRLREVWACMPEPRRVMAVGACSCSGGAYVNYATLPGADAVIPVDVYVPGCPPRPEALIDGLLRLQARIRREAGDRGRAATGLVAATCLDGSIGRDS